MSRLRLLIVSPRYWPQVGDQERLVAQLVQEFAGRDVDVTVLTAKWHGTWPEQVYHRQAWAIRLPHAPRDGWTTFRYLRELSSWLHQHRTEFDLVYVMNLRQEAYATLTALQGSLPVVLHAQRGGMSGDVAWQERARFGKRIRQRCQQAAAVVATCLTSQRELVQAGYSSVIEIAPGVRPAPPRLNADRFNARSALAQVNHDLGAAEYAPVAVCIERLEEGRGLSELIRAWTPIAARWPTARLWLVGDGPLREALYGRIGDLGLRHQILMPGSFDDISELLQAADLFLSPARDFGFTPSLLEAMAHGLPIVGVDSEDRREVIRHGSQGELIPFGHVQTFSESMSRLLEDPRRGARLGQAAQRRVVADYPLERTIDQHLDLFQQLRRS